jgi:hypothetical protein
MGRDEPVKWLGSGGLDIIFNSGEMVSHSLNEI